MSKHTAGPWVIIPGGDEWSQGRIATIEPKPETMIETNYWTVAEVNNRRDEREANALLISAAPDLLEALEMAEAMLCRLEPIVDRGEDDSISVESEILTARAAIAKARG